jgi:TM2 domain-containing membrane protein YozV
MKDKNPGFAGVLSFFIPGLGQIYNGEFGKATGFIVASVIGGLLTTIFIGFLIIIPVWAWGVVDAYYSAEKINEGVVIED